MTDKKAPTPETIKVVQVFTAQATVVAELCGLHVTELGQFLMYWGQKLDAFEQCLETVRDKDTTAALKSIARGKTPEDTMEEWRHEVTTEQSAALAIIDDIMITAETYDKMYRVPHLKAIKT
jgi:hypothetical protein